MSLTSSNPSLQRALSPSADATGEPRLHLLQLLASPFVGGPCRQVLGLAKALRPKVRTTFASFSESGKARAFLNLARREGFDAIELKTNFPRLDRAVREMTDLLRSLEADVLCCNGYKPDIVGWRAGRRAGVPVLAIAHGWTSVTLRVRFYEAVDAMVMRRLDAVVCVSEAMARTVRQTGVDPNKITTIRNAIDPARYLEPRPLARRVIESFFPKPPRRIIGAAGRLSVEKGFDVLVEAAAQVCRQHDDYGFLIFGEGPMRGSLEEQIQRLGLESKVILGGFRSDLEEILPAFDLAALSSHTEGLPVAVLEAQAAGVPVVATAVGGTPEVIQDGVTGYLVPPANPLALADKIVLALADDDRRQKLGRQGRQHVCEDFTFAVQATQYLELFARLAPAGRLGNGRV